MESRNVYRCAVRFVYTCHAYVDVVTEMTILCVVLISCRFFFLFSSVSLLLLYFWLALGKVFFFLYMNRKCCGVRGELVVERLVLIKCC